jgi:acyl-CoA thioesterase-1
VINASISGETSAGGLRRIDKALAQHQPTIIILELGANDGLRGTTIAETEKNLRQIISMSKKTNAKILLLGMQLPPNYGLAYTAQFRALFSKLAQSQQIAFIPFLLEGISADQFQPDNLHPNASAQKKILNNVLNRLNPMLK